MRQFLVRLPKQLGRRLACTWKNRGGSQPGKELVRVDVHSIEKRLVSEKNRERDNGYPVLVDDVPGKVSCGVRDDANGHNC